MVILTIDPAVLQAYHIQIHSPIAFIGALVTVVLAGSLGTNFWLPGIDPLFTCVIIVSLFVGGFLLAGRLSTARIIIHVDEGGFHHGWVKRFFFSREPDIHLPWDQVIDYFFEEDRTYFRFQLTLKGKQRYRFYRQTMWPVKDDFYRFQEDFPDLVRKAGSVGEHQVVLGKTIYEERWFKWVLLLMAVMVLLLFVFGDYHENWGILAVMALSVAFYWTRVRTKEKGQ